MMVERLCGIIPCGWGWWAAHDGVPITPRRPLALEGPRVGGGPLSVVERVPCQSRGGALAV